ncbi:TadE/TadG family type IV pilus assembly protein [Ornithinimicrobium sp. W1679]|uniref:TadE/TadG family type IV pilus assembly protein n=1 Tax=Ornithinimicrobium sp. W1679 TaxID=3418770 RepID=UPI003CF3A024
MTTDNERGAVAIMFGLLLVMLLGFIGMGVDVASAYAKSQEVQNGADAGALAVAAQCATTGCAGDDALADEMAESNIRQGIDVTTDVSYPEANQVTVVAETDHANYFLGLFGQQTFRVGEQATAEWSSPQSGPSMLPLVISACDFFQLSGLDPAGEPALGTPVSVYLPKPGYDPTAEGEVCTWTEEYPPGGFGWLDADDSCQAEVEVGGTVPGDPGLADAACVEAVLEENLNKVILIPIFSDQVGNGSGAMYTIERFAALELLGYEIQTGNVDGGSPCHVSPPNNNYSKTCIYGKFQEWVELGGEYTGGAPETEVTIVTLID